MTIKVRSFGATEGVTGSCHLVEVGKVKILIDCGMFQGIDENKNYDPFPFNPQNIDYLILTHAHIDHIGRVPKLIRHGFRGKIISTKATKRIARIMLLDSARVMLEEYKTQYKKALRRGKPEDVKPPIYYEDDVYDAMEFFKIELDYHQPFYITDNIKITFFNAGHILGSAFVKLEIKDDSQTKNLVFSGDLGLFKRLIIRPMELLKDTHYVYIETTYANRKHKSLEETIDEFKEAILNSFENGGNIIIPTFALERAQEILFVLRQMYEEKQLPKCKVFLDSPLAISATRIFLQFPELFNQETQNLVKNGINPFDFPYLEFTQTVEESKKINEITEGAIILAGSGMCSGGRIKHHLKHNLWRKESSIIFVGYQAKGTLGRQIVDGAKKVKIYNEEIAVKAKVYTINGFSSHADQPALLKWLKSSLHTLRSVYLIHGEPENMKVFKDKLSKEFKIKSHIVKYGETIFI